MLKVQEQAVLRMLAPYPNASILDVGGGHGQLTPALVQNGYQVTILASSEDCKARIQPYLDSGRIAFDAGSLVNMPYSDQSFDVVICLRLMAHMTRWEAFIGELARVARKAVILDYPEVRSINYLAPRLFAVKKRLEPNTRRFQCFREGDLLRVFEEVGFKRAGRFPQYFLPMMLHRVLRLPRVSAAMEGFFRAAGLTGLLGSPVILKAVRLINH